MNARQVMTREVVTIKAEVSVYDAAHILLSNAISAAPVVDADRKMIGIVSEADLMNRPEMGTFPARSWLDRLLAADEAGRARDYIRAHAHRVADVMTKDVVTAGEQSELSDIAALMRTHRVERIPILRQGSLVGIVSRANLLQGLMAREPMVAAVAVDDETVRSSVAAAIAQPGRACPRDLKVVVERGVVHIWGSVAGQPARDAMRVAAENVRGVRRVENHIALAPVPTDG